VFPPNYWSSMTSIGIGQSFCAWHTRSSKAVTLDIVDPLQEETCDRVSTTLCNSDTCEARDLHVLDQRCTCHAWAFTSFWAILLFVNKVRIMSFNSSMSLSPWSFLHSENVVADPKW
jgi:hypothetical protein